MTQRLMVTNLVQATASVLSASSAAVSNPVTWVQDQLRSKRWRSEVGWNIVASFNDRLDFYDGSTRVASLTVGNYASGDDLATEIQTRMNAVSSSCTVSYSTTTKKFTIARSGTLQLRWQSGSNADRSIGEDIGFDVSANDTGSSSYVADDESYRSREWVKVDLGSALAVKVGAAVDHNAGAAGAVTLQGNASDSWSSPTVDEALGGDDDLRAEYIAQQTLRYWRLVLNGVSVDVGYTELGVWFLGSYTEPTVCDAIGRTRHYEQLSTLQMSPSGSHFRDERAQRAVWSMSWSELEDADRIAIHDALFAVPRGKCFFFGWDDTDATDMFYVFLADTFSQALTSHLYHDVSIPVLAEALP